MTDRLAEFQALVEHGDPGSVAAYVDSLLQRLETEQGLAYCTHCTYSVTYVMGGEAQKAAHRALAAHARTCMANPLVARITVLTAALDALIIDANRLCDRQLGGTYEEDCRRSLAAARAAMQGV